MLDLSLEAKIALLHAPQNVIDVIGELYPYLPLVGRATAGGTKVYHGVIWKTPAHEVRR